MLNRLVISLLTFMVIQACETEITKPQTAAEKRLEDINTINDFIDDNELGTPDTTDSGARFFIYSEGDQSQSSPVNNQTVSFGYTGWYLSDSLIFMTTVPALADSANLSDTLDLAQYTFSETGWTLRYVFVTAQYGNATGLAEAITEGFKEMVPGDSMLVLLPYDQAVNNANTGREVVLYGITLESIED